MGTPPSPSTQSLTTAELTERARGLITPDRRTLLGLTGPPGAGKSTLASALAAELKPSAVVVPMDGFHLPKAELATLGRLDRMGAPDTFDADGFVALIRRLREARDETVLAPRFDRRIEAAVPGAIGVGPEHRLVIVEGNYLLLEDRPWSTLRDLLDEIWYVDLDERRRLQRLIARHVKHGKPVAAARAWSLGPDEANAELIAASKPRADLVVSLTRRR